LSQWAQLIEARGSGVLLINSASRFKASWSFAVSRQLSTNKSQLYRFGRVAGLFRALRTARFQSRSQ
jgi:hypothetical protein